MDTETTSKLLSLKEELDKDKEALNTETASSQAKILSLKEELDKAKEALDTETASSQAKILSLKEELDRALDAAKKITDRYIHDCLCNT